MITTLVPAVALPVGKACPAATVVSQIESGKQTGVWKTRYPQAPNSANSELTSQR
ncbi:MAG TPA: hypothetical protein VFJ87_00660 [Rhodanobacteraceae bacterium]|jgi:hypothetical protein|nr:hypothetical protein [Rhodanobacteraceae bacterium]